MGETAKANRTRIMIEVMREAFAPEARDFLEILKSDLVPTTKDNYGRVMTFLGRMPEREMQAAFLGAMVDAGYPAGTAETLREILRLDG